MGKFGKFLDRGIHVVGLISPIMTFTLINAVWVMVSIGIVIGTLLYG